MKRFCFLIFSAVMLAVTPRAARCADVAEEEQQIAILQSNHSPAEKDAACARLKWIGTSKCIPALAKLLTDEQLSHSARYALESMPGPEAETALLEALAKTSGSNQIGIINSLAVRRDTAAVPALGRLLSNSDTKAASAAAMALGRIGDAPALKTLQEEWSDSASGALRDAEVDGLLACANNLLTEGRDSAALSVFQKVYDNGKTDRVRQAAFCGVILASGRDGISLMANAIGGNDGASQAAALQVAVELEGRPATRALADLLPNVNTTVQIALLDCLGQRRDPFCLPAVVQMAESTNFDVRLAAIKALGDLGDGSVAALLARKAAEAIGVEKSAVRQALLDLRRGAVTPALLKALATATPAVKSELIWAIGNRGDMSAVPKLLELARSPDDGLRSSSLQALELLAGPAQLPDLVQLVVEAKTDEARSDAADALSAACQRIESRNGHCNTEALVQAARTGPLEARLALLPVCSGLTNAPVREALRAALEDSEPRVRQAAWRALCDTRDGALLPDLLKAVTSGSDEKMRLLTIRGCVRLATQEENVKLSNEQKLATLKTLLDAHLSAPEKRLVLSGLSTIPNEQALDLASAMLDDPSVKAEAALSVIQITDMLPSTQAGEAMAAVRKVMADSTDPAIISSAEEARKKIWKMSRFVTVWQVAGPYEQKGKDYSELFNIPFGPEGSDAASVRWQILPVSANPADSWKMDLLHAFGGDQRAAYARTWIHSPKQQDVRLELGSDDGVKVWLNGAVVLANNAARPLQPASDHVDVTLNEGWNVLMLKVTQSTSAWEFCARFAQPSGEPVPDLQFSLDPSDAQR
jgi:HEAT repeat protein